MRPTDIQPESDDSTDTETKPQVAARIPAELDLQIERIAYQETEPGGRTVRQSQIVRAALRFYAAHYDGDAPTAHEAGAVRAADTIYGEEPTVEE
jgi:hypothetical protein